MKNPFLSLMDRVAPVENGHDLDFLMERETLSSEIRRVRLLMGAFAFFAVFYVLLVVLAGPVYSEMLYGQPWKPFAVILLVLGYETLIYQLLTYLRKNNRRMPLPGRYGNALAESTLLSAGIVIIISITSPAFGLGSPPAYLYFIFIIFSTLRLDFGLAVFTGVVMAVEYGLLILFYAPALLAGSAASPLTILAPYLVRCLFTIVGGVAAGFVAGELRRQFQRSLNLVEERNRVNSLFGQFVSPEVREKLLSQKIEGQGEIRQVCLMFLDIRGFTHFAEGRSPQEVVQFLNTLFEFMVESVTRQHGIINKFLGDGFMAVFGAPLEDDQHVLHATTAALEILSRLDEMNRAGTISPTRIGIGLHAGEAVTGAIGSLQRKEYTIIGDTVNLAARLEELNKAHGSRLLVSGAVWEILQQSPPLPGAQDLGEVTIRGREAPIRIYRLD